MNTKKIRRILLFEIVKEYINTMLFILVVGLLIFLGERFSYFAYLFLAFLIIGVLAQYFQTSREKSVYKQLFKISKFSSKRIIESIEEHINSLCEDKGLPPGINYVNRKQSPKKTMSYSRSNNVGNVTINSSIRFLRSGRRGRLNQYNSDLDKKINTLLRIKDLLEVPQKSKDIWDQ